MLECKECSDCYAENEMYKCPKCNKFPLCWVCEDTHYCTEEFNPYKAAAEEEANFANELNEKLEEKNKEITALKIQLSIWKAKVNQLKQELFLERRNRS